MITREKIFEDYPFLVPDQELNLIVGDDLDSIISAYILLKIHPRSRVVGLYNLERLWYNSSLSVEDLKRCVYVDLDICHPECRSIGHHILRRDFTNKLERLKNSLNLNELFKCTVWQMTEKYPFGTAHFLLWLYDIVDEGSHFGFNLYATADSTWINCQRYDWNCEEWLTRFPNFITQQIFDKAKTPAFEEEMEIFYQFLEACGIMEGEVTSVRRSHFKKLGGHQGAIRQNEPPTDYIKRMMELCGAAFVSHDPEKQLAVDELSVLQGERRIYKWFDVGLSLDEFLEEKKAFSYAITDKGQINLTSLNLK